MPTALSKPVVLVITQSSSVWKTDVPTESVLHVIQNVEPVPELMTTVSSVPITELLQNVTVLKDNTLMPIMFVEIVTINVKLVNHTKIVKSVPMLPTEKTLTLLLMSIPVLVLTDTMITELLSVNNVMLNVQLVTPMSTV
jgi:hypothetical protein